MKYRRCLLVVLLVAAFLHLPAPARAEAPRQDLWGWMMQLPSTWLDGLTSIWQREGATIDPAGRPGPAPTGHPAGGLEGPALDGEGSTIDPWGQPAPGAVYGGVEGTIEPWWQPKAGSAGGQGEGDVGPYIDPFG